MPADRYQRELRLFAAGCVRRAWHLLPPGCRAAVDASERFAAGRIGVSELASAVAVAGGEAQEAFPGHSAPDARGYAASAAVDASSVWPRSASNVLAATSCAASAVGCAAGEANAERYDEAFEAARVAELAAQAALLRELVSHPPE
ncbi:hypothetical protein GobsT_44470 [Gemmata obscuriglobus]|nr:hypothetical protein GobsT_44050 [Gemmata obscuriglobus]QEG29649.1 hypothetical protein GobsT_44470 [Gemmata obscuriglobus]VTS08895.1 unnamed protein product [Gemmata obscuriglobus UQM 2246]VTS08966.1 unnamed protein product [Gemmata obscuriglobus UQM 2246]